MGAAIKVILAAAVAYALGNISPSIIQGKLHGIDIKKEGSGNAGTTNTLRVLGKKAAVITLVIDVLKGVAAVLIGGAIALAFLIGVMA
jgi:glycerol-3-phosphate acyltransferase PlsY